MFWTYSFPINTLHWAEGKLASSTRALCLRRVLCPRSCSAFLAVLDYSGTVICTQVPLMLRSNHRLDSLWYISANNSSLVSSKGHCGVTRAEVLPCLQFVVFQAGLRALRPK